MSGVERPQALVLGVGGTLGEAWIRGVLAGIEDGANLDFRDCEAFVGTSAGSIVAARLAAGVRPAAGRGARVTFADAAPADGPPPTWRAAGRAAAAVAAPFAPAVAAALTPPGALLRAAGLAAVPAGTHRLSKLARDLDSLDSRFDGRLRIPVVDRRSGRRVVLGAPGAPEASITDAVLASCAIPGYFEPIRVDGREYVDGGVWSPTNLDVVPADVATVLCLAPSAHGRLRTLTAAARATEGVLLRKRGVRVRTIVPDAASAEAMGSNLMDGRRSGRVLTAAFAQGRRATGPA
jgi:NTE family protein